jgi:hypothetical protein
MRPADDDWFTRCALAPSAFVVVFFPVHAFHLPILVLLGCIWVALTATALARRLSAPLPGGIWEVLGGTWL